MLTYVRALKIACTSYLQQGQHSRNVRKYASVFQGAEIEADERSVGIDIYIPAIEKDLGVLPIVVKSIREMVQHRISGITVIGPNTTTMRDVCREHEISFMDENDASPIKKSEITYVSNGVDRSGWLFQQILKIQAILTSRERYVLICDADTVFVRQQSFVTKQGIVYDIPTENHKPYKKAYNLLTGLDAPEEYSFVAHHLAVDSDEIRNLAQLIETRLKCRWWEGICGTIDVNEPSCFSEYDLMGYFSTRDSSKRLFRDSKNLSLPRRFIWILGIPGIGRLYRTISFHAYSGY